MITLNFKFVKKKHVFLINNDKFVSKMQEFLRKKCPQTFLN